MSPAPPGFTRIVVAFDGSERALDALALGRRLLEPAGALVLACVSAPHADADEASAAAMLADARAALPPGIRVATRSLTAPSPAHGLTGLAETEAADLVVVGSSRRGERGRISLERTAGRLLNGAPCAVAVPPADLREPGPFGRIGVAYDGSPEARAAFGVGAALALRDGAAVTVLHARSGEADAVPALPAAPEGVDPRVLELEGEPGTAIAAACDGVVDLLLCGSRGYGPIERALLGSVSGALVDGASHPVVVLPRAGHAR